MAAQPQVMSPGEYEDEQSGEAVPLSGGALSVLNRSEIEQQIAAAEKRPRSIEKFRLELEKYSCLTPEVALSMFYTLKRSGKPIVGPSVRFAEVAAICWRNNRSGKRSLGADGTHVSGQGLYYDCETNVGFSVEAKRSIVGKEGRYSNDMITVTGNAASSVAHRNAIFVGIPRALWNDIYEKAKETAVGKAESFAAAVVTAMEYFAKSGATEIMVLNTLAVKSVRDIDKDHILVMRVWAKELKEGDKSVEDIFGSPADNEIEEHMETLGWSTATKTLARTNYKGRRSELLEDVRARVKAAEAATGGKPTVVKTAAPPKPKETVPADPTPSSTATSAASSTDQPNPAKSSPDTTAGHSKPAVSKEAW
jgi:hypothetical protein